MINKEDKADVARHLGKALAKKVSKATNDYGGAKHNREAQKRRDADPVGFANREKRMHAENDMKSGNYVKLRPTSEARDGKIGGESVTAFSPYRPDKTHDQFKVKGHKGLSVTPTKFVDAYKFLKKK